MNQEELLKYHEKMCIEARHLMEKKNTDYASPDGNTDDFAVFRNFLQCESLGICSTESGFLVRISDKLSRLSNILKPGKVAAVKSESVHDTLLDTLNYSILLDAFIQTKNKTRKTAYLSGRMTGIRKKNFPKFNRVAWKLRQQGYKVVNPAEFEPNDEGKKPWEYYLVRDISEMNKANLDLVITMRDWEKSRGSKLEVSHALNVLHVPVTPLGELLCKKCGKEILEEKRGHCALCNYNEEK